MFIFPRVVMAAKSGSDKKSGSTSHSLDAGEKDSLIIELKNRVIALENELRSRQDVPSHDIERERAEEALRESEERFRNVFENAASGILIADVNRCYLAVNDRFCEITGYSREQLLTMGCGQIVHPDDQAADVAGVRRLLQREASSFLLDLRYVHASGRTIWARVNVSLMSINNQEGPRIVAVVEDVTERRRAEDALRKNEKFLNNVFNCIQDGLTVLSKDLSIIRYNPTIEKWHGKDLTGKKCYRLFHGCEEPCETCPSLRAIREKTMQREIVHDLIGWKELYAYPLVNDDGEVTGTIEQVRDITERKQAEEELQRSEEKYRRIVETADEGIWIIDRDTRTTFVNDKMSSMLGYTVEEMSGKKIEDFTSDFDLPLLHSNLDRHRDGVRMRHDFRFRRKDGRHLWCIISATPILDDKGDFAGGVAMITDITERKRAEDELNEAKSQAELYLDLLGHDINNMHQIALGYLEMAQDTNPEACQSEFLDKPIEVLQRSTQLIKNVRKLQKLRDGMFQNETADVCKLLTDVQSEFGSIPHKTITLNMNACEHCYVRANELLHDVFANLVSNAIKHTGDRADIVIDLNNVNDNRGRYCRVVVEDNGPGIPDDFKDKIFNRLLKGTSKAKGMGLGLYLVKSLVDSYGGRVWVEDRVPGDHTKGARFVVMLPAVNL